VTRFPYHQIPEQSKYWLATTDAKITYIGEPINPLTPRSALVAKVIYCDTRVDNTCGGVCTGGAICINAPGTNCLFALNGDVSFCSVSDCPDGCDLFSKCKTPLDKGFVIRLKPNPAMFLGSSEPIGELSNDKALIKIVRTCVHDQHCTRHW
jgi:hypothetical protein